MSRAVHRSITKPSIAEPSNASHLALYRRAVHHKLSIATSMSRPSLHCQSITTLPSRSALYRRAIHRQAVHCQAVHCAGLSIASRPLRHCRAVHCSIAKPFFTICLSRAIHRCIVKLSSSIASCPFRHCLAIQRFIAKLSIASPRPLRAVYRDIIVPSIATLPSHPALHC